MLKGLELKRDIETVLVGTNQAKNAGNSTTARLTASVLSWIKTNTSKGRAAPTGRGRRHRHPRRRWRAPSEANLKSVLKAIWDAGGKPDTIMVGGFNKQVFSTFTGRATPTEETKSKKIVASVDVYESDFGTLKVVANRFQRPQDVLVLQLDMWALGHLNGRKMTSGPPAGTGGQ